MVRLRNCAATLRQRPRLASMSFAFSAFRKLIRLRAVWQDAQFWVSTGRIDCANSSAGACCCGAAPPIAASMAAAPNARSGSLLSAIAVYHISQIRQKELHTVLVAPASRSTMAP